MTMLTLAIFLVSIWGLTFYTKWMLQEDTQRQLGEQQLSTAALIAKGIDEALRSRLKSLEQYAKGRIDPLMLNNAAALQERLEGSPAILSMFNAGVFVTGVDGVAIASVPASLGRVGVNYLDRDFIATAIREGRSSVGKPVIGKMTHKPILTITVPIRGASGSVIGTLNGATDLVNGTFLDEILVGRYGKSGGYLVISPQDQVIVVASDKTRIMQPAPAPGINAMHDRYMQGYEGYGVAVSSRGINEISAARRIPVSGWFVVVTLPTEEAFAPIYALTARMIVSTLVISVLAGGTFWWLITRMLHKRFAPMISASRMLSTQMGSAEPIQSLPIASQDEVGELVGSFNDLLALLKQRDEYLSRERTILRTLIDTLPDLIWLKDANGVYIACNSRFEQFFGAVEADIIGKTDYDFVPKELADLFRRHDQIAMEKNGVSVNEEEIPFASDGHREVLETTKVPMRDTQGSLIGVLGIGHDITQRKADERKLEHYKQHLEELVEERTAELSVAKEEAEAANRAKSVFLANMSHELRTPMNGVLGMAHIVRRGGVTPKQAEQLDKLDTAGKHLVEIINAILDLSKIEAGKVSLEEIDVDLKVITADIAAIVRPAAEVKHLELSFEHPSLPYRLTGDPTRLKQALLNYASNAVKFTERGQITLRSRVEEETASDVLIRFEVEDTGVGIAPEAAEKLFRAFEQADSATTRKYGGTGLGLVITKKLAEMMGGATGVSSLPDRGSTFWFTARLHKSQILLD